MSKSKIDGRPRCYHCGKVLNEDWLRSQGARLMGRKGGSNKARSPETARKAALVRWGKK